MEPGVVALVAAAAASVVMVFRPHRLRIPATVQLGLLALALSAAFAVLARATLTVDGRYAEVADTASRATPWPYRLAGLWGGPRSSLLTFVWMIAMVAWAAAVAAALTPVAVRAMSGLIGGLSGLVLVFANPFTRLDVPAIDGGGLTPILRHPAMLVHPVLLYFGLVLTLVSAFAFIEPDERSRAAAFRLARLAWGVLVLALALGSWWAHAELGWGGLWAWDPIENAGLVPFLLLTAAIHLVRADQARHGAALVMVAGWCALAGSTITRSGIGQSVHAFASAERLGRALALVAVVAACGVAVVIARQRGALRPEPPAGIPESSGLSFFAAVMSALAAFIVTIGTVAPVVADLAGSDSFSVAGRFYRPLWILVVGGIGALSILPGSNRWVTSTAAIGGLFVAIAATRSLPVALLLAGAFAAAASQMQLWHRVGSRVVPMTVAHLGGLLLLVGVGLSGTGVSVTAPLQLGESVRVQGHEVRFDRIVQRNEEERTRVVAELTARSLGRSHVMRPSLDRWNGVRAPVAETATVSTWAVEVQAVLRSAVRGSDVAGTRDAIVLDVHVRPFVRLVWWGAALMGVGALLTTRNRRAADDAV